jgi:hypothetical protein
MESKLSISRADSRQRLLLQIGSRIAVAVYLMISTICVL